MLIRWSCSISKCLSSTRFLLVPYSFFRSTKHILLMKTTIIYSDKEYCLVFLYSSVKLFQGKVDWYNFPILVNLTTLDCHLMKEKQVATPKSKNFLDHGQRIGASNTLESSLKRFLRRFELNQNKSQWHSRRNPKSFSLISGNFSFGSFTRFKSHTITGFVENAVEHSRSGRYLFFLNRRLPNGPMRVQLLHPVSRVKKVQSLQHMCR